MATFKLKRLPQPTLRMKALPRFPARLQGGDGVTVTQSGGVLTVSLDPDAAPSFDSALPFRVGDLLVADDVNSVAAVADVVTGNVLLSGGVAAPPVYGKVGLTTHVAGILPAAGGGTGVDNAGHLLTLQGDAFFSANFFTTPANSITLTTTGATNVTLPTTGALATLAGAETLSNKNIASPTISGTATIAADANASGAWTFTIAPTSKSSDAGAAAGPFVSLFRDSASPAASDLIGFLAYYGRNSTATTLEYARAGALILDPAAASEDSEWSVQTRNAGTLADRLFVGQGLRIGSPTGGDKGAGTINVSGNYYVNGAANRIRLSADTNFYVATTGNDTTGTGLTAGSPWLTIQKAINVIAQTYDLAGYQAIINVADGTYSSSGIIALVICPFVGGNPTGTTFPSNGVVPVIIRGNTTTPTNVVLNSTANDVMLVDTYGCIAIEGCKLTSTTSALLHTGTCGTILFGNVTLGASGSAKVFSGHSGVIEAYSDFKIDGNSTYIFAAEYDGSIYCAGRTITQSSNVTVTAFARSYKGEIYLAGNTYATGGFTFTGSKFDIGHSGGIRTGTNDITIFPGSTAGTMTWGTYDDMPDNLTAYTTFTVRWDDAGAGAGPSMSTYRNSASPAASDLIGEFDFYGKNSSTFFKYAKLQGKILDPNASSEDSEVEFHTAVAGTLANRLNIGNGMYTAGAAGGDKGANTINASNYYLDGVAPTGSGALVRLDNPTLTTALTVSSATAGAGAGPQVSIYRNITAAANNLIGFLALYGNNTSAAFKQFVSFQGKILTATAGAEDGQGSIQTLVAGTLADRLIVANGGYMTGATGGDKGAGTFNAQALYVNGVKPIVAIKRQTFTSGGTYTPSTGMLYCIIECVGPGGGGGGAAGSGTATSTFGGAGGGAGGYSRLLATAATIGASKTVTVSAGGAGGTAGANNGSNGAGDTSVGTLCVAKPGSGGQYSSAAQNGAAGAGGVAGTGDITASGMPGGPGFYNNGAGGAIFITNASGFGGSGPFGGGGAPVNNGGTAGTAGGNYGSGGSGGYVVSAATNVAGGNGAGGFVIITEFCSQ